MQTGTMRTPAEVAMWGRKKFGRPLCLLSQNNCYGKARDARLVGGVPIQLPPSRRPKFGAAVVSKRRRYGGRATVLVARNVA